MHDFPVCLFNPAFRGCQNPINGLCCVVQRGVAAWRACSMTCSQLLMLMLLVLLLVLVKGMTVQRRTTARRRRRRLTDLAGAVCITHAPADDTPTR